MAQTGDFRFFIFKNLITFLIIFPPHLSFPFLVSLFFSYNLLSPNFSFFPLFFFFVEVRRNLFFFSLSCRREIPIVWYERNWPPSGLSVRSQVRSSVRSVLHSGLGLVGCRRPEVSSVVETTDQSWRGRSKDVIAKRFSKTTVSFAHT
ncbi:hypothetical protein ASPBRDRAFT_623025 [Aspergillus brasiliensis CBS 101740]|uniref:Transmembrane protein n=1 Tax=Aspergillus brasiliensis (strain CBS 101740 / IMI 381727 / IBT 21946) TaxID=767769 RepID=A0A1L9UFR8_ASPBC|nr:hypothetical protein ASPBRDRAFT_623025 [Aspergillus brasiliensis CBS 101740]